MHDFRQEHLTVNKGNLLEAIQLPYISICPIHTDRLLIPVTGFDKYKFSFEKFHHNHQRSILTKQYLYYW